MPINAQLAITPDVEHKSMVMTPCLLPSLAININSVPPVKVLEISSITQALDKMTNATA